MKAEAFTFFDLETRAVVGIQVAMAAFEVEDVPEGCVAIRGNYLREEWFLGDEGPERRPTMQAVIDKTVIRADGEEVATVTGPEGAEVSVLGTISATDIMDSDGIAFSTDYPGKYTIRISLFPYLDWEAEIEAT